MTRKKLYKKYILWAVLYTAFAILSTAILEKVIFKTPTEPEGGDNPIATILGVFGSILFLMTFLIGIPSVSKWYRKRQNLSRKAMLQLHCDLATTATVSIGLHVIFVSLMPAYSETINWYSIYPWIYEGWTDGWNNEALAFTMGSWAGFFMLTATVAGLYKNWVYKHWSRTTFIIIQNLTIISLISLTIHQLNIGSMTSQNLLVFILTIAAAVFLVILWIIYNYQMFKTKSGKKKTKNTKKINAVTN